MSGPLLYAAALAACIGADDDIIIMDDDSPQVSTSAATSASIFTPTPRLNLGLASRLSSNVFGNGGGNPDVSGLEWWNLGRARASLQVTQNFSATFEGWVRWGMTGAPPQSGTFWGFNVHDVYWQSDVQLREAAITWNLSRVTLRVGQQLYVWGKNEWGAAADVINPYDLRYDLFAAFTAPKDIRVPVWSMDATYHGDWGDITLVLVPFFTPNRVFISGHDISMTGFAGAPASSIRQAFSGLNDSARDAFEQGILGTSLPDASPENFSLAARVTSSLHGWDIAATAWFGWDRTPVLEVDSDALTLIENANALRNDPRGALQDPLLRAAVSAVQLKLLNGDALAQVTYRRFGRVAVEAETALDPFVLRFDAGYTPEQTFYTQQLTPTVLQNARAVGGVDYLQGDWFIASLGAFVQPIFSPPKDALLLGLEATGQSTDRDIVWLYGFIGNLRWVIVDDVVDVRALASVSPQPLNYAAYAQVSYLGWAPHNLALGALLFGGRTGTAGADLAHDRFVMLQYEGAW